MKKIIKLVLASLLFVGSTANAALVGFSLIGLVSFADPGNTFGVVTNEQITANGFYDDAGLTEIDLEILPLNVGGASLLLEVGDASFTQGDDANPSLMFIDGFLIGLNFLTPYNSFGSFTSNGEIFLGNDGSLGNGGFGLDINGIWSINTSPVPVPAAVWLFGSGLVGLAGVARRRKTA